MPALPDVRCPKCRKLLLRGSFIGQIKCPKCGLVVKSGFVEEIQFPFRAEITQ